MTRYDSVILGGTVVVPRVGVRRLDLGIKEGKIVAIDTALGPSDGEEVVDARGLFVFPGAVDAHFHIGIYRSIEEDAASETESSLVGGATTILSYFRTGHHYLNRTGSYAELLPLVLERTRGRAHTDFGYHLAPMDAAQVGEIDRLVGHDGIASFKYFMMYKGLNLASDSTDVKAFTMSERYDFGHLYAMMEAIAAADARHGGTGRISLSVHCENAELIIAFIERIERERLPPLEAYSRARPPLGERLSIHEAAVLASGTGVRLNLLHLSSAEALLGADQVRGLYPQLDIRAETTLHHLALTYEMLEGKGLGGKVNPPIRTAADCEALWKGVLDGRIDWVASDHACCMESMKGDDLWPALPGFGGTALLYPVVLSEGHHKRGLPLTRVAELVALNPATAFGCSPRKGTIAIGCDADVVLIDLEKEQRVRGDLLHSEQDHTPFEGIAVKGWPVRTMLRGKTVYLNGAVVAPPSGEFLYRPAGTLAPSSPAI